jgi:hypothetical protein
MYYQLLKGFFQVEWQHLHHLDALLIANQNRSQNSMQQVLLQQKCNIQVLKISLQFMYTFCNIKNKLWIMYMAI